MSPGEVLRSGGRERGTSTEAVGYRSPWYTGYDCSQAPEPDPYRQWREARTDWVTTQRPEDFERMLVAVTPDTPPLASDIQCNERRTAAGWPLAARMPATFASAPSPSVLDRIGVAVALTAGAITALTAAVVLIFAAVLAIVLAVIESAPLGGSRDRSTRSAATAIPPDRGRRYSSSGYARRHKAWTQPK